MFDFSKKWCSTSHLVTSPVVNCDERFPFLCLSFSLSEECLGGASSSNGSLEAVITKNEGVNDTSFIHHDR